MIIENSNFTSPHLIQLRHWFEQMWGKYDEFEETKLGLKLPNPIIAVNDGQLIGGLAFTAYKSPENDDIALWINALYIDSSVRRLGYGSKLIRFAEKVCKEFVVLYAQTNVPDLYIKNGWSLVEKNGEDVVLKKEIGRSKVI